MLATFHSSTSLDSRKLLLRLRTVLLAPVILTVLAACAPSAIGSGVILWSPDESVVRSGSVVTVVSQSDINNTFRVSGASLREPIDLDRWRIELFTEKEAADAYAARYRDSLDGKPSLVARATRNALPMRAEPRAVTGNTIYRLRENEEIKIVGRQPEQTNIEGLVSYWYEAMTATGERGWVFGYTLRIFDPTSDTVVAEAGGSADPLIDLLLQNVWRPMYFLDMISNRAFDLETFRPEYGLFPRPENNQFELVLPAHATVFEYERIARAAARRYVAEGTSLQLNFQRNDELNIQYSLGGRQYLIAMQRVPGEIDEYVAAELERREAAYERLHGRGPELESDAYGILTLEPDERFTWMGYERLVPAAISHDAGNTGRVDLGLFLSPSLRRDFDGAVNFHFDGAQEPVAFAYRLVEGGVRFVWIPPDDIRDHIVQRTGVSPLTVFMSAAGD